MLSSIAVLPIFPHKQSLCVLSLFVWLRIYLIILNAATCTFCFLMLSLWRPTFITINYCWSYSSTIKLNVPKEKCIKNINTVQHLGQERRPWFIEMELDCICDMRWYRATFVMETIWTKVRGQSTSGWCDLPIISHHWYDSWEKELVTWMNRLEMSPLVWFFSAKGLHDKHLL